jgi:hypothetical protein
MASNWAGYADDAPTPYPAVLLAPRATICALEFVVAAKVSRAMMIKRLSMCSSPAFLNDYQLGRLENRARRISKPRKTVGHAAGTLDSTRTK